ncbi:hypothetical protein L195_g049115, partial [Trifolium pratense]
KHGFPPGYRFKDGTLVVNKHHGQASAHYGHASANHVASEDHGGKNAVDNRIATFSSQEYQALMALLKSNSQNAGEGTSQVNSITKVIASSYCNDKQGIGFTPLNTWILDSGATDHICASLSLFTSYRQVKAIPVKLPNGNTVITDTVGDICITSELILKDVLYMPYFRYNLISVSRVTHDLDCKFVFTNTMCIIQNALQRTIGLGKLQHGLYYLDLPQSQLNIHK